MGTWITEASVVRDRGQGWWQADLGMISLDPVMPREPGFLSSSAMGHYISSALNNILNLLITGVPIDPFVEPGIKLKAHLESLGFLEYANFHLNPQTGIAASLRTDLGVPDVQGNIRPF